MQYVSTEYREAMKQPARNKSYMRISLGLINQAAQTAAEVQPGGFTYFSDVGKPISEEKVSQVYATLEKDFSRVNQTMYFLPRASPAAAYYNAGIVTESLCGQGEEPVVMIRFSWEIHIQ